MRRVFAVTVKMVKDIFTDDIAPHVRKITLDKACDECDCDCYECQAKQSQALSKSKSEKVPA